MNDHIKKRKAALHNLGCKVNSYELEAMQQQLEKAGYEIVPFEPGADVYVINTCTVTNIADRKSRQMLHRAKKMNPDAVVVAVGCYAQVRGEELSADPDVDIIIGSSRKGDLVSELEKYLGEDPMAESEHESPETVQQDSQHIALRDVGSWKEDTSYERLEIDRTEEHTRAFIKVQDGCNQFCSYCIIPFARGRVRSRAEDDVVGEIRRLASTGVKEVVVTGIHLCSYGADFKDNSAAEDRAGSEAAELQPDCRCAALLHLLQEVNKIDGIERIRLGSLEPGYIDEAFIRGIAALPKICPHFHLSLQSGCAKTLKNMNRKYTPDDFAEVAAMIRKYFEHPALCTDIITGFPGETEEDFEECRQFVSDIHFFETHIFPYSRRKGTVADRMSGQNTEAVKKARGSVLHDLDMTRRKEFLRYYIGRPVEVLFEEQVTVGGRTYWSGHGREYQKVLLADTRDLTNQLVTVTPAQILGEDSLLGY
jgi:threonylcarbamoyladenosine tRNA methylthiotransferase MtaB